MSQASGARNVAFVFLKFGPSPTLPFRRTPFSLGWFKALKNLQSLESKPLQPPLWEAGRYYYVNFINKLSSGRRCPGVCFNRLPCPCLSRPHMVLSGLLKSLLVHMALLKQFSLHSLHDEQPGLEMPPQLVTNQLRASRGPSLRSCCLRGMMSA